MKKILLSIGLASILASSIHASNFGYKKSDIGSYMFGLVVGGNYSQENEDYYFYGGLNTNYMYDITERINIGGKAYALYETDYGFSIQAYPYVGYKVTEDFNAYVGYGLNSWFGTTDDFDAYGIDYTFLTVGVDYYISEDLIIELNYKRKSFDEDLEPDNTISLNIVIPFNFY